MDSYIFYVSDQTDLELAWQDLENKACGLLYSEEEEQGAKKIIGYLPPMAEPLVFLLQACPYLTHIEMRPPAEIDWESQWALHAEGYKDGMAHIALERYAPANKAALRSPELKMHPGAGFGDLSHATTRLVMKFMGPYVRDKCVLDVGCGSGILSLAAWALGAAAVTGVDIDHEALNHAQGNALLNHFEQITICQPQDIEKSFQAQVVLMNMIHSEQEVAWQASKKYCLQAGIVITSGVLAEARAAYLAQAKAWGWQLVEEAQEEGWLGFVFALAH